MYSVGEAVDIYCADTTGSANLVLWLNSTGTVLSSGSTSATLPIALITDRLHGEEYTCRTLSQDSNYTIFVLSEFIATISIIPEVA